MCEAADRPGAEVDYPAVLMHATSRDGSADPAGARPAVFCQVEADPAWGAAAAAAGAASAGASGGDDGSADRDAGAADVVTMLLMPSAAATVLSSAGGRSAADAFGAGAAGGEAPEDARECPVAAARLGFAVRLRLRVLARIPCAVPLLVEPPAQLPSNRAHRAGL